MDSLGNSDQRRYRRAAWWRKALAWASVSLLGEAVLSAELPPLWQLSGQAQQERIAGDVKAVRIYRSGLRSVVAFAGSRPELFPAEKLDKARMLRRGEKEAVWAAWKSFLDYILALDVLGRYHREFFRLKGPAREESFLVGYAAFLAQYRYALEFIDRAENDPGLHTLLNEPVPEIGLPEGMYARLKFRFLNVARASEFAALQATAGLIGGSRAPEVRLGIEQDAGRIWQTGRGRGEILTARNALQIVKSAGFAAWFPLQAGVAEWMGDTKVLRRGRSLASPAQIQAMTPRLEPGDILLVRREWYLSNIGLPGFWPHAALFIGTPAGRRRYFDDPDVKSWVQRQGQADGDFEALLRSRYPAAYTESLKPQEAHVPRVLEAISEGVSFTSIEHSADADSVAVLRPRLPKLEKAVALLRAFHYAGRPYDFDFDFLTDSALVCTELVSKAYEPSREGKGLRFPLVEILGRKATPANEITRQFDAQFGAADQQTDLILFLDGYERLQRAVEAGVEAFRQSWKRPKWHILVQELPPQR